MKNLKSAPNGFEPKTPRSVAQRGTTEPTIAATENSANLCYLCTDLINYAVSQVTGMQILDSTDQNELSFPKKVE